MNEWKWVVTLSNEPHRITRRGFRKPGVGAGHEHAIEVLTRDNPPDGEWKSQILVLTEDEMSFLRA